MGARQRLGRAAVAATVATGVALASHVLGGGAIPAAPGIAVPLALSFAVCVQIAGRELSWWRTASAVTASQVLFHTLFVLGSSEVALIGATHATHAPHAHHGDPGTMTASVSVSGAHGGAVMSVSHLVAAALTTAALMRLEWAVAKAAVALAALVAALVPADPEPLPPSVRFRRHQYARSVTPVRPRLLAGASGLRGPPLR